MNELEVRCLNCNHPGYEHTEQGCIKCRCDLFREVGLCEKCGLNITKEHTEQHAKRCLEDISDQYMQLKEQAYKIEKKKSISELVVWIGIASSLLIILYYWVRGV